MSGREWYATEREGERERASIIILVMYTWDFFESFVCSKSFADLSFGFFEVVLSVGQGRRKKKGAEGRRRRRIPESAGKQQQQKKKKKLLLE
jgi:hypothetical protein